MMGMSKDLYRSVDDDLNQEVINFMHHLGIELKNNYFILLSNGSGYLFRKFDDFFMPIFTSGYDASILSLTKRFYLIICTPSELIIKKISTLLDVAIKSTDYNNNLFRIPKKDIQLFEVKERKWGLLGKLGTDGYEINIKTKCKTFHFYTTNLEDSTFSGRNFTYLMKHDFFDLITPK
ncbi:hypothetical protein [Enterococcus cecorum]|uniref:hypothetical protein n=4 Tax=Enterococcus cecorum TaxID=44008 RepID=UPI001FABC561|nr:hypothetical protein [Enterococcus cecorum]